MPCPHPPFAAIRGDQSASIVGDAHSGGLALRAGTVIGPAADGISPLVSVGEFLWGKETMLSFVLPDSGQTGAENELLLSSGSEPGAICHASALGGRGDLLVQFGWHRD